MSIVEFTATSSGDWTKVAPPVPAGNWIASCMVKKRPPSEGKVGMFILEWHLEEALDEENESYVEEGKTVADYIMFLDPKDKGFARQQEKVRSICKVTGATWPKSFDISKGFDDFASFIEEVEGGKVKLVTRLYTNNRGELATAIGYKQAPSHNSDDD